MSDPVWYRSLYWRITFGFIALLAMLLLVQGLLFLWLTDRFVVSSRPPSELARQVATDVGAELERNPGVKIEDYVRSRFSHVFQPFLVVLRDGQRGVEPADRPAVRIRPGGAVAVAKRSSARWDSPPAAVPGFRPNSRPSSSAAWT